MNNVVILTGNELRHKYFRTVLSHDTRFELLASYCEGTENSLEVRTKADPNSSELEILHVNARTQSEEDFFGEIVELLADNSNPRHLRKGGINDEDVVNEILDLKPHLLACYGSSLIKSSLIEKYKGRFLNVHLGLSPYYRGIATNIWPLINNEPEMVGATFMHIDAGIDTGKIIHQIRADINLGDGPHTIGNRLIRKMTRTYCEIIARFPNLSNEEHPSDKGRLYYRRDFDACACARLYKKFSDGMIQDFINRRQPIGAFPYIVNNRALRHL